MPACLIDEAGYITSPSITKIINYSILTAAIPTKWKQVRVTPLYIDGKKLQINNYRSILVLSVLSMVLECIVHAQLSYHVQ